MKQGNKEKAADQHKSFTAAGLTNQFVRANVFISLFHEAR